MKRLLILILTFVPSAQALDIGGSVVINYRDREGTLGLTNNAGNGGFNLSQTSIRLSHDFSDWKRMGVTLTSSGGAEAVSEGWLALGGLPYYGEMTIGRFYKPLGAPVQTLGLSYPALLFHTSPVLGAKVNMEYYPWSWELGVANNNPFSATGSVISGSTAFGRPIAALNTSNKEVYGFLRWRDGGEWGALDVNAGYTFGEFSRTDLATLTALNVLLDSRGRSDRHLAELAADYTYGPFRVFGQYAQALEGPLNLTTWNVSGSYRMGKFNYTIGYDELDNNLRNRPVGTPASWARERITYNVTWELHPSLQLALEYEDNEERITGNPQIQDLPNNAVTLQVLAVF